MDSHPYNPLDKANLGASVAEALLARQSVPLGRIEPFVGAGVYAIYYVGDFTAYAPLVKNNETAKFPVPIYVGKAVPPGARKGNFGLEADPGPALYNRLKEHAESVRCAGNLRLDDFLCKFLVVDDIWIPLGEALLVAKFSQLWNKLIDGFGNHDPGKGRYNQMKSRWDVLHPGREWASRCAERPENQEGLIVEARNYLELHFQVI